MRRCRIVVRADVVLGGVVSVRPRLLTGVFVSLEILNPNGSAVVTNRAKTSARHVNVCASFPSSP